MASGQFGSWSEWAPVFWLLVAVVAASLAALVLWQWDRDPAEKGHGGSPSPTHPRGGVPPRREVVPAWPGGPVAAPPSSGPPGAVLAHPRLTGAALRPGPADSGRDEERRRLVLLCIDVADRLRDSDPALRSRLHRGLAEVGVEVDEPAGSFDHTRHDAISTEAAASPEQDRWIVRTERAGYRDGADVVRRPEVVLFSWEEPCNDR